MDWKRYLKREEQNLPKTAIFMGTLGFVTSVFLFLYGFHSVDLSYNMQGLTSTVDFCNYAIIDYMNVSNATKFIWNDIGSDYVARDYSFWYIHGHNYQRFGIMGCIFSGMIFGWGYANVKPKKHISKHNVRKADYHRLKTKIEILLRKLDKIKELER